MLPRSSSALSGEPLSNRDLSALSVLNLLMRAEQVAAEKPLSKGLGALRPEILAEKALLSEVMLSKVRTNTGKLHAASLEEQSDCTVIEIKWSNI